MPVEGFNPPVPPTESSDKPEVKLLKAEFGDGYTQVTPDGINYIRRVYSLSWDWLTPKQAQEIEDFWFRHRGGADPFYYQPADIETAVLVTCEEFQRTKGTPNKVEMTLRQSFMIV